MKLKDVTVTMVQISTGMKGPNITALATFQFDLITKPQYVWVDLTSAEAQAVATVLRAVEHRFLSSETSLPEETKRPLGFDPPEKGGN